MDCRTRASGPFFVAHYYRFLMAHLARGDFSFLRAVEPDAELTMFGMGTYRGAPAWAQALEDWRQTLGGLRIEVDRFIDPGGHKSIVLLIRLGGEGTASGATVMDETAVVLEIEDGMCTRGEFLADHQSALAMVGL